MLFLAPLCSPSTQLGLSAAGAASTSPHLVLPHLIPLQSCSQSRGERQGGAAGKQRQGKAAAAEQMPRL